MKKESDDYLWDKSGTPDAEIQRLEDLLKGYAKTSKLPALPGRKETTARFWPLLLAASVVLALTVAALTYKPGPSLEVARLEGEAKCGNRLIDGKAMLKVGQWLQTEKDSVVRIEVASIGRVDVGPESRVCLKRTDKDEHRLELARGSIDVKVNAPPRLFLVETPSALAVDLGCAYTLRVDDAGGSWLEVTSGWVAFEHNGKNSLVPAGAQCRTRLKTGPGTPFFKDASSVLRDALTQWDLTPAPDSLGKILAQSRPKDSLTLWHILQQVKGAEREQVFDKLATLVQPPPGVNKQGILILDPVMLELWKDQMQSVWRRV